MFACPYPSLPSRVNSFCRIQLSFRQLTPPSLALFFPAVPGLCVEGDSKIEYELQAKVNAIHCFSFPGLFSRGLNHPLSLRSQAEANAAQKGLPAKLAIPMIRRPTGLQHIPAHFAKSNSTFSELEVRFKWASTMKPALSSFLVLVFSLSARL